MTDDVVINTRASYAGGYGHPVSTSSPFSLTPSLQVNSSMRSYLKVDHSRCCQPNIAVLWLEVLPVREVPGSDSGPEIGYTRGVQPFLAKGYNRFVGCFAGRTCRNYNKWYA